MYEKIIERVQTDRTRNPRILLRALKVLKEHLVDAMPSPPVRETIDQFCCSVAATDPQTRKVNDLQADYRLIRTHTKLVDLDLHPRTPP